MHNTLAILSIGGDWLVGYDLKNNMSYSLNIFVIHSFIQPLEKSHIVRKNGFDVSYQVRHKRAVQPLTMTGGLKFRI